MNSDAAQPSVGYVHVMYALHAFAGFVGVTSGATIVGAFVFGLPSILAIIMNYARRDAVRGSWLESHFRWQSNTFWTALLLWIAVILVVMLLLALGVVSLASTPVTGAAGALGAGAAVGGAWLTLLVGAIFSGLWILYRVIRGWMALGKAKAMYA